MKPATIKIYVNQADPNDKIVRVKGPKGCSASTYVSAKPAAADYARFSTYDWWNKTVNKPWRSAVDASGAPIRYQRMNEYDERVFRRVLKILKSKGLK